MISRHDFFYPFKPLTPMPPVTARDKPCPLFHFAFDHNCHHLHVGLTSAGGKDLSNDTQIKVISSMETEIYTKMQNFLPLHMATPWQKVPVWMVIFMELFKQEAIPEEGQSLQQKDKKRRKKERPREN